eukprot:9139680-Alexandrium_andersonii.AAC.1
MNEAKHEVESHSLGEDQLGIPHGRAVMEAIFELMGGLTPAEEDAFSLLSAFFFADGPFAPSEGDFVDMDRWTRGLPQGL